MIRLVVALGLTIGACSRDVPDDPSAAPAAPGEIPMGAIGAVGADVPAASASVAEVQTPRKPPRKRGSADLTDGGHPSAPRSPAGDDATPADAGAHKTGGTTL